MAENQQASRTDDPRVDGHETYLAPFEASPASTTPWRYYVVFGDNHTREKHLKAIGLEDLPKGAPDPSALWSGSMTDEHRELIRTDPGVLKVIQYSGGGEWH